METLEMCKTLENKYDPKVPTSASHTPVADNNLSPPQYGVSHLIGQDSINAKTGATMAT